MKIEMKMKEFIYTREIKILGESYLQRLNSRK